MNMIRTLNFDEIECRVQQVKPNGCGLLLYKDARCDMRILDETFGIYGWEREHSLIDGKLFCTVRIWDKEQQRWVSKQDVGTESYAEKEKGQASDSFKRACFNLGIGRELYTAPFIWIKLNSSEVTGKGLAFGVKFKVKEIEYNDKREITKLVIIDQNNKVRFSFGSKQISKNTVEKISNEQVTEIFNLAESKGVSNERVKKHINSSFGKRIEELTMAEYERVVKGYQTYRV